MVELIESFIQSFGVWGFFGAILLEEILVPLPSSMIMLAGGFFLIKAEIFSQAFSQILLKLAIPGALGVTLGSLFFYFLSFFGREVVIKKMGPWFGFSFEASERIKSFFGRAHWDEFFVFFLRAIPVFPGVAVSVMAGLIKMPAMNFVLAGFGGSFVRILLLGFVGWQAKEAYAFWALRFENLSNLIFLFFVLAALIGYLFIKRKLR